ncbi:crotonase/enoyl-CoA hydratase family protein [Marinivivus vitaminiproducens]|uniref:crotonase/enoyl-CoA hydratase family protein n=1 Tax=Marinivivus vitaminiproducens TaxID=3035935 RepID=UPI00279A9B17|nr:crotonase/enoyl-CoA hydratase family protein [Geminicoccaceae bacterium SCSIO 64248]
MTYETLTLVTDDRGVATLTLDRPERHNAMSGMMIEELDRAARELGADRDVRAVVLTGAGTSFCAGADLGWMKAQFTASRDDRLAEARRLAMMLHRLNTLPKPLIGRVQGQAYGGGIGLIAVCDVAIAIEDAKLGLTETRLGLIPATIGPYVLARMGEGRARRVFMSARLFSGKEGVELGLVARAVPVEALNEAVEAEVRPYLSASPDAVAAAKALARSLGPRIDDGVIDATIARLADSWDSAAAREGIAAFFEKRKPAWSR